MNAPSKQKDAKFFMNLPELVVGGFVPAAGPGAGWCDFEYELEIGAGRGLFTGALSPAGELVLELGLTGWQVLHVGHNPALRVWLDGDAGYCQLPGNPSEVSDQALPPADFTGKRLHIAPAHGSAAPKESTVFYLRAEPCAPSSSGRNLIATNDGHGVFFHGVDSPRDIWRHVYPFRDSDFFRMVWGLYGGSTYTMRPDTKVGQCPMHPESACYRAGDFEFSRSLAKIQAAGADPLALVRQATREYGLELHYYCRVSAFFGPFPHLFKTARFFTEHPEWHCRDEFGQPIKFISYAYPQVQDHMLAFFDELLDYEPDGICLAFNRGLPLMCCEEPVLEAYRRKYGRAPKLPEEIESPEMLNVRYEILAGYVERVARLVEKRGKSLSAIIPRNFPKNLRFGLDADMLVRRGLFESVMVGAGHGDIPGMDLDLEPVKALKKLGGRVFAGGSSVNAHGGAWNKSLQERARHMANILDAGLDGGWFWDAELIGGYEWQALRNFGNRTRLDDIIAGAWPVPRRHETRAIGGYVVGRYNPWNAY
jgi:hypothetical protein